MLCASAPVRLATCRKAAEGDALWQRAVAVALDTALARGPFQGLRPRPPDLHSEERIYIFVVPPTSQDLLGLSVRF